MSEERAQSEFNMAVSYLNRLNALFYIADESAMQLDIYTWFHSLLAIYRELSTEMKEKELAQFEQKIGRINPLINTLVTEINKGRNDTDDNIYKELHLFEIELRKIMKESGLQNKMQEDARRALR